MLVQRVTQYLLQILQQVGSSGHHVHYTFRDTNFWKFNDNLQNDKI